MGDPASSSSGEEDGDADWKEAIDSVASVTTAATSNGFAAASNDLTMSTDGTNQKSQSLKHYQIKVSPYLPPPSQFPFLLHIFLTDLRCLMEELKQGVLKFESKTFVIFEFEDD